jgi:uncharacterized protein (DUF2267 family)
LVVPLFDRVNQKAVVWVHDMMTALRSDDEHQALHALRAGLHALRDRLTVEAAAQLSAQLPLLVRGLFFENWDPTGKPIRIRRRADFLALVREYYAPRADLPPEDIMTALFRVLEKHISVGEITDIVMNLPEDLRTLTGARHGEA